MPEVRAFAAIEVPSGIKEAVLASLPELTGMRKLDAGSMHITLSFFGYVDEERLAALAASLSGMELRPFRIAITGLSLLNMGGRAVLYAGIEDKGEVSRLHSVVSRAAAQMGMHDESRRFMAHMTVARIRDAKQCRKDLAELVAASKGKLFGSFDCRSFLLVRSRLTQEGPIYSTVAELPPGRRQYRTA